jgi:hypothetical protein
MNQEFQPDFSTSEEPSFEPAGPTPPLSPTPPAEPLPIPEIIEPGSYNQQPKKSNVGLIVVIVLLLTLCCCCILVAVGIYVVLYGAYWLGDAVLNVINQFIPNLIG